MAKLLWLEGTDTLVMQKSQGHRTVVLLFLSTTPTEKYFGCKFSYVTVPTSLSLLLFSGFSPLEPAGSFFLKHKVLILRCSHLTSVIWAVGDPEGHRGEVRSHFPSQARMDGHRLQLSGSKAQPQQELEG